MANNQHPTPIVLVHGLYETTWYMKVLAHRLTQAGYPTHLFRYYSLVNSMARHSEQLSQFIAKRQLSRVHLIGHSLGGLVIRQFLHNNQNSENPIEIDKVLTLGTPHLGSIVAHYTHKLARPMIKNAFFQGLDGQCPPLVDGVCLGVIAGTKPQGLGKPILTYSNYKSNHLTSDPDHLRHDGTVYVFETKLPNAHDHITLPVSHTGMLFDRQVVSQILNFLGQGRFCHLG